MFLPPSSAPESQKLVVKPDQLIKRRGKLGLILVNSDLKGVKEWVSQRIGKDTQVGRRTLPLLARPSGYLISVCLIPRSPVLLRLPT